MTVTDRQRHALLTLLVQPGTRGWRGINTDYRAGTVDADVVTELLELDYVRPVCPFGDRVELTPDGVAIAVDLADQVHHAAA